MKISFTKAGLALGFVAALGVTGFAQSTQSLPQQTGEQQMMERRGGRRHRNGDLRVSVAREFNRAELNLTDAQQQQLRAIDERTAQSTEAQRTELRGLFEQRTQGNAFTAEQAERAKTLRNGLRDVRRQAREEALAVLTAEQRTQLEQSREQRRQQHEARRALGGRQMRGLGELNLSAAQQQQMRQIRERYAADIRAQRGELRLYMEEQGANSSDAQTRAQRLEQLNEPIRRMRAEMLAILTSEQRTQLEQRRAEHRARRGQRGERFRRQQRQTPPMPGNTQP